MKRLAVVDVETTGTEPGRHQVFEVALLLVDDLGTAPVEHSWWLKVDLSTADPNALRKNRYYERLAARGKNDQVSVEEEVAEAIASLTANRVLVGAVPSFDARFLEEMLRRHGFAPAWHYRPFCVETAASGKLGVQPPWESSDELAKTLGVPSTEDRHTALGDVRWAWAIYRAIFGLEAPKGPKKAPEVHEAIEEAEPSEPDEAEATDFQSDQVARMKAAISAGTAPEGEYRCEACSEEIDSDQALKTWSRWRRILCKDDSRNLRAS